MNNQLISVDQDVIDELVAGGLTDERYRLILEAIEAQPEKWRDCAIAFLEEQALEDDLKALVREDSLPEQSEAVLLPGQGDPLPSSEYARLQWMQRVTSLAALLLVSFTVGWFGSGYLAGTRNAETGVAIDPVGSTAQSEPTAPSRALPSPTVPDGGLQFVSDQIIPLQENTPAFLRQMDRGPFEVESYNGLVPVMEGDTVILVPVQQHRVRARSSF